MCCSSASEKIGPKSSVSCIRAWIFNDTFRNADLRQLRQSLPAELHVHFVPSARRGEIGGVLRIGQIGLLLLDALLRHADRALEVLGAIARLGGQAIREDDLIGI